MFGNVIWGKNRSFLWTEFTFVHLCGEATRVLQGLMWGGREGGTGHEDGTQGERKQPFLKWRSTAAVRLWPARAASCDAVKTLEPQDVAAHSSQSVAVFMSTKVKCPLNSTKLYVTPSRLTLYGISWDLSSLILSKILKLSTVTVPNPPLWGWIMRLWYFEYAEKQNSVWLLLVMSPVAFRKYLFFGCFCVEDPTVVTPASSAHSIAD